MPNHYSGDGLHPIAISGHSRANRAFELTVVPASAAHPVQMHRQLPRHRYLGNLACLTSPWMILKLNDSSSNRDGERVNTTIRAEFLNDLPDM